MSEASRTTPLAIVGGACIIALSIYFGLRARPAASPPAPLAPSTPQASTPAGFADRQAVPVDRAAIDGEVTLALQAQRSLFRQRCAGQLATADAGAATYGFDIGLAPDGREISRGVSPRAGARSEVADCLRMIVAPIKVTPPGRSMTVRTTVELPGLVDDAPLQPLQSGSR